MELALVQMKAQPICFRLIEYTAKDLIHEGNGTARDRLAG